MVAASPRLPNLTKLFGAAAGRNRHERRPKHAAGVTLGAPAGRDHGRVAHAKPETTSAPPARTQWDKVQNPGGFIHGALVAGTTLAVATTAEDTVRQTVVATIVVLVVYWATHSYTEALGERIADPHERPSVVVRKATKQERSVFVGGLPG